jgi:hypothetical protein
MFDEGGDLGGNEEATFATFQKNMRADPTFGTLMDQAFRKRLHEEEAFHNRGETLTSLKEAAVQTSNQFELGLTKAEQLAALRAKASLARSGWLRFFPPYAQKVFDFTKSLLVKPDKAELRRNAGIGLLFVWMCGMNSNVRGALGFYGMGLAVALSQLLMRNMPQKDPAAEEAGTTNKFVAAALNRDVITFTSSSAFRHALLFTLAFSVPAFSAAQMLTRFIFPSMTSDSTKLFLSMALSLIATFTGNSYFEVFEEKGQGGWRWEQIEEQWSEENLKRFTIPKFTEAQFTQLYDYELTPAMIDEGMAEKIFAISANATNVEDDANAEEELVAEADKTQEMLAEEHYQKWLAGQKEKKRISELRGVTMDDANIGTKKGFLVNISSVEPHIHDLYHKAFDNPFSKEHDEYERKSVKDIVPKQPDGEDYVPGPLYFRDVRPKWLSNFLGDDDYREFATAAEKAAQYGIVKQELQKGKNKPPGGPPPSKRNDEEDE